ncbi:MAG TPA: GFA family protein [Caulobacteraceae bacterium]|nr:GFA family protein [Caulobacteraceae bacterium]
MPRMRGGCLCGQVRYFADAEPAFLAVCHCKNCQKQAGTAFSVVIGIPKSAMAIEGRLKTYRDSGDSGQAVLRNFCPECGSPITSDVEVMPELTFIKAGTLDDTDWLDPKMHVYCASAQRWTSIPEASQKFAKMPG